MERVVKNHESIHNYSELHQRFVESEYGHGKSAFAERLRRIEPDSELIEFGNVVIEAANLLHGNLAERPNNNPTAIANQIYLHLPAAMDNSIEPNIT